MWSASAIRRICRLALTDPEILLWCEREDRILVSFDKSTLTGRPQYLVEDHAPPMTELV